MPKSSGKYILSLFLLSLLLAACVGSETKPIASSEPTLALSETIVPTETVQAWVPTPRNTPDTRKPNFVIEQEVTWIGPHVFFGEVVNHPEALYVDILIRNTGNREGAIGNPLITFYDQAGKPLFFAESDFAGIERAEHPGDIFLPYEDLFNMPNARRLFPGDLAVVRFTLDTELPLCSDCRERPTVIAEWDHYEIAFDQGTPALTGLSYEYGYFDFDVLSVAVHELSPNLALVSGDIKNIGSEIAYSPYIRVILFDEDGNFLGVGSDASYIPPVVHPGETVPFTIEEVVGTRLEDYDHYEIYVNGYLCPECTG